MKILKYIIFLGIATATLWSCESTSKEDTLEEIEIDGSLADAKDIIRKPIEEITPEDTSDVAKIVFDDPVYDFGKIKEGKKVKHEYTFKNTGTKSLKIEKALGSCGCTVADIPSNEIAPGESGKITAVFNSEGREGVQNKTITVESNAYPSRTFIFLKGWVESNTSN